MVLFGLKGFLWSTFIQSADVIIYKMHFTDFYIHNICLFIYCLKIKKNAKVLFADLAHFTMAWIYKQKDTAELQ